MTPRRKWVVFARFGFLALLVSLIPSGCSKEAAPPPSLTLEQLPPALQTAFAKAKPETKQPLADVLAALEAKDHPKALLALQALAALPGLTREQARVAAAGVLTLHEALQQAQTTGDQQAAQTLEFYHRNK